MVELKVWVEGIQRVVCGVCDRTTCQDVVYALAHATGKTGRFTLIERWRNNERLLAPHEHPLKVLLKWGEYSSDVHFILQRTALDASTSPGNKNIGRPSRTTVDPLHGFTPPPPPPPVVSNSTSSPSTSKDLKKSLTFSGGRPTTTTTADNSLAPLPSNVGVVRGVPKNILSPSSVLPPPPPPLNQEEDDGHVVLHDDDLYSEKVSSSSSLLPPPPYQYQPPPEGRMVYPRYDPPGLARLTRQPPPPPLNANGVVAPPSPLVESSPGGNDSTRLPPPYRNPPQPFSQTGSTPPTTKPPPYREPPAATAYRASPAPMTPSPGRTDVDESSRRPLPVQQLRKLDGQQQQQQQGREPSPPRDPQYAQLIQLVNRQRGGLDDQQERLVQLERELIHWEERLQRRLDQEQKNLTRELAQLEDRCRQQDAQLADLVDVEDEWDRLNEEERQLKEELERLRADTTAIESQLVVHSSERLPALRNLVDERIAGELQTELTRVKGDVEAAGHLEKDLLDEEEHLQQELDDTEGRLQGIRAQMEHLTNEIKQANLMSLSIAPADDLKVLLEGSHSKSGHSRRMLGSPRQLENPLPTNKNPHGVWV